MTRKTNALRDAVVAVLVISASATAGTQAAMAQDTAATGNNDTATNLDRIEVTGTRIRQADIETAQPVLLITRADIEKQGFQSVSDILQNISATGTPPISRASPLLSGETAGGTFISLRNLGAPRTLILLNGRRLGISTSGLSDVSTIPASAVERIEVLKDGASSIYGSDAIAGVINVITRSNFEGVTASVYHGQYGEGDGAIDKGDIVMGFNGERGSLTIAAEVREEDAVRSRDREFSAFPRSNQHPTDNWTTVSQFGGFVTTAATAIPGIPTGTRVMLRDGGDPRNPADYRRQNINTGTCVGSTLATGCTPGSTLDKSNTNQQTDVRTPLKDKALFADGVFDITDALRFRGNFLYSKREATRTVAGFPLQATSPTTLQGGPAILSANSYFNPTGAAISNWWRRTWELPRVSDSDLTTRRFVAALEGSFTLADRPFDWDVSYLTNENRLSQANFGNTNIPRLRAAVGPSFLNAQGRVQCGTAAAPISFEACVPFNPFLPFGREGQGGLTNNAELQDFLFTREHTTGETDTRILSANLTGSVFTLPAGDLAFALGAESRKESGRFVPDPLSVSGQSTNLSAGPTSGEYTVDEAYLELQVPILADLPFARELTLSLASRFSDYDTFGETTNNKFGLKWKPFDSLLVRATAADGFRAPTIADLFGGGSQTFSSYTDPCDTVIGQSRPGSTTRTNCARDLGALANTYRQLGQGNIPVGGTNAQTPIPFTSGSNPALLPEQSKSQTIGLVWSPTFAEGLNLALDWWKVRIADTIVVDSPDNILNDCYVQGIQSRCSSTLFTRDPVLGIPLVTFININAGFRKVEGYDFDISYRWKTENWGDFRVVSNTSYVAKDYFVSTDTPTFATSLVGIANVSTQFRIRSNLNLSWEYGMVGISWIARYYSSLKENCTYFVPGAANLEGLECNEVAFSPNGGFLANGSPASLVARRNRTGSNTFNDVQVRIQTPWDATVSLGANNVFDRLGQVLYTMPSANVSYYGGFDIGRFVYMKYTQRF
ncbi:MAG: TonB-dependent receptor domain-containing protein [Luteimonas sp.]